MFKRQYRLPARVKLINSSSYKIPSLKLLLSGNDLSYNRFGFVISKKIAKSSVVRNRTRRVVRSCLEEVQEHLKAGYDMLFILQKNSVGRKREEVFSEIAKMLKDAKLLK